MRVRIKNLCYLHRRFKATHGSVSDFVLMINFFILRFFIILMFIYRGGIFVFLHHLLLWSQERG